MFEKIKARFRGTFLFDLLKACSRNDLTTRAANLALFSIMSVFPFIAILVWLTTLSGSAHDAHVWSDRFDLFLPPDFAKLVTEEIDYRLEQSVGKNAWTLMFHMLLLLFSAGAAVRSFLFSLREIAIAEEKIGIAHIFWRSFFFIIPIVLFVFIASGLVGVVSYIIYTLSDFLASTWLVMPLLWLIITLILVVILNGVYASSLIGHQIIRIHGWLGSSVAAALVTVVTLGLTAYYEINPVNREWYGSPGFIINVLLWFYACSVCVLLGAQINAVNFLRNKP
ncbi:YihY/virulence factor BrkB family protein [Ponticaulis profundi]|uniref:YihY/virulence factor BrkB family protein n=1 Tax=Ponticaulis profundi TaxID=2665222 RepID=A0ABW1S8W5_9PROT